MKGIELSTVWVVIAAFNEEQVIAKTVANVLEHVNNVIVVDDCSTDCTSQKAVMAGAHVLCHPINLGQGGALQTGITYALKNNAKYVITFDADGQHNAEEILPMLSALQESKVDIVLGSRFIGKTVNMPRYRQLILKLALIFTRITGGIKLTDVHNGFRAMSHQFCEQFEFNQPRMAHASEILNYISKYNIKYTEFPVTITYTNYSIEKGQKHSNAFRVVMELLGGYISR
jgi:glycosyltransferase involved in cell wall biosynthesis